MISHTRQYFLPVGRLRKDAGNGHRTRHRTKNDEEISLPFRCVRSRHKLHPLVALDHPGHAGTAQPFTTEFASGRSDDAFAGPLLMFRFVTHLTLDYLHNLRTQIITGLLPSKGSIWGTNGVAMMQKNRSKADN